MTYRLPVWDSHAYDQQVVSSGFTFKQLAAKIHPMVGHLNGTKEASVIAFHAQGREPNCYAILCALANALECTVEDFYRRS